MENLKQTLPCPFCEQGTSTLKQQETTLSYKETSFTVTDYFYRCDLCQEQFTTTESDTLTLSQIPGFPTGKNFKG